VLELAGRAFLSSHAEASPAFCSLIWNLGKSVVWIAKTGSKSSLGVILVMGV
jgi:hypothetical protein